MKLQNKKINFLLLFFIFIFIPQNSSAKILINEIMYDAPGKDTGREWIEIYNLNDASIDLAGFNLATTNNHRPFKLIIGSFILAPYNFALIVSDYNEFKKDYPDVSGTVFQSTLSLNNTGGDILLKNNNNVVDQINYQSTLGANEDGETLQKFADNLFPSIPTPGRMNIMNRIVKIVPSSPDLSVKKATIDLVPAPTLIVEKTNNLVIPSKKNDNLHSEVVIDETHADVVGKSIKNETSIFKWLGFLFVLLVISILPIIFFSKAKNQDRIKIIIEE